MRTALVPPLAGLFSSAGLLFARTEFHDVRFCRIDARASPTSRTLRRLEAEMRERLERADGLGEPRVAPLGRPPLRGTELEHRGRLPRGRHAAVDTASSIERFEAEHERLYGTRLEPGLPGRDPGGAPPVVGPPRGDARVARPLRGERGRRDAARRLRRRPRGESRRRVVSRAAIGAEPRPGRCRRRVRHDGRRPAGLDGRLESSGALCSSLPADAAARPRAASKPTRSAADRRNALATVADEMATTIFRTAHSTVVRDAMDFSAALCGPTGETVAQAVTIPLQLGSIPNAMRALFERFGDELARRRLHGQRPVRRREPHARHLRRQAAFADGRLIGFARQVAHHGDVGGRVPGTSACDSTDVFQEGLRLPWMRLCADGEPIDEHLQVLPRERALPHEATRRPERAGRRVHDRRSRAAGLAAATGRAARRLMDACSTTRSGCCAGEIAGWPDGTATFTDYMDSDGIDVATS